MNFIYPSFKFICNRAAGLILPDHKMGQLTTEPLRQTLGAGGQGTSGGPSLRAETIRSMNPTALRPRLPPLGGKERFTAKFTQKNQTNRASIHRRHTVTGGTACL